MVQTARAFSPDISNLAVKNTAKGNNLTAILFPRRVSAPGLCALKFVFMLPQRPRDGRQCGEINGILVNLSLLS